MNACSIQDAETHSVSKFWFVVVSLESISSISSFHAAMFWLTERTFLRELSLLNGIIHSRVGCKGLHYDPVSHLCQLLPLAEHRSSINQNLTAPCCMTPSSSFCVLPTVKGITMVTRRVKDNLKPNLKSL